jgi:hypothetical protein
MLIYFWRQNKIRNPNIEIQKPQPKIGISRAKAQRPQRKKYFPNLAFLASWRENNPKRLLLNGKNRR